MGETNIGVYREVASPLSSTELCRDQRHPPEIINNMRTDDLKYTWRSKIRAPVTQRNYRCGHPHSIASIDSSGRVFVCMDCWVPWPVAELRKLDSIDSIWQQPNSKRIQRSTNRGNFKFCDIASCGIHKDVPRKPKQLHIGIDDSCNLRCPSCREHLIYYSSGTQYEHKLKLVYQLSNLLERHNQQLRLIIGSNGDAFASSIYQQFYRIYKCNPLHEFELRTNGLMVRSIDNIDIFQQVKQLHVSIDAGTEKTYELVRLGGRWHKLIDSLDYIQQLDVPTRLLLTVQRSNLYDLPQFADLCEHYGFEGWVNILQDWGTWPNYEHHRVHTVQDKLYNDYSELRENLKDRINFEDLKSVTA